SQRTGFLFGNRLSATIEVALDALRLEKDTRGWTAEKGWAHALAHAADLIRALGRHPALDPRDRERLANALTQRLRARSAPFAWGEEVRIASALAALFAGESGAALAAQWIDGLSAQCKSVWSGEFVPARYHAARNAVSVAAAMIATDGARGVSMPPDALTHAKKVVIQCQ
ncbi:MAG: DUF2785 domain-containing protein, partial [Betaproteobacteria bacterium]|nr:DUF2785 domain-containing protein [Betaproteobacteria bacterium]